MLAILIYALFCLYLMNKLHQKKHENISPDSESFYWNQTKRKILTLLQNVANTKKFVGKNEAFYWDFNIESTSFFMAWGFQAWNLSKFQFEMRFIHVTYRCEKFCLSFT